MKNPLRKRIPRELKGEFGKYLVVFILMVTTIGMVSGFLVADGSMIQAYNEGFEKYNIEDGNFRTGERLYRGQREAIEEKGVKVYENYYIEDTLTNGSTMRFFKNRTDVNKVCLMDGKLAEKTGEIAIDRMYADNNDLKIGDTLEDGTKSWTVTGLVALSDYSCLFQNNSDTMFDAVKFGVGLVTEEEFDTLDQDKLQYNYAWTYNEKPQSEIEEKDVSEDLMKAMGKVVTLENFVPQYQNQAIIFTGDDMGSDKAMMVMLLYIIIVIMAFSPLGYLRTPGLTITFLTVPVAVGAIILGPAAGAVCGAAFGCTSIAMAMTGGSAFSAALLQINPFGLLFTLLVPRILEGWLCGLVFQAVKKFSKNGAYITASLACPVLNTVLFMSSLVLFFYRTDYIQSLASKLGAANPFIFVVLFVGLQGLIEAVVCTFLASAVSRGLAAALKQ